MLLTFPAGTITTHRHLGGHHGAGRPVGPTRPQTRFPRQCLGTRRSGSHGPLGKLGREVSLEQGYIAARLVALSILGSLHRALGDLDRVAAWSRVLGMVNSAPGFNQQPNVINGFSDLILELYGPDRGAHSRSAVGLAELPFNIPVEIEGEVELIRNQHLQEG
ncbi:MAG: RidA family protein [Rhodanobacter sp.]|nr:MAG: RidA family protein [Rhodanobacter sp.]TAM03216.1 MAG: RidA family protein [Rhodanobacter sp.]TAM38693.1 MAG: RidA family protein [Rhodanobacter sp.]TAN23733.1 MAG: RidA family protein [Rhodanobacter sp.]